MKTSIALQVFTMILSKLAFSQDVFETQYECSQVCGYTSSGETLSFFSLDKAQAQNLVVDSCRNMNKKLWGEMRCTERTTWITDEHYYECAAGTIDGLQYACLVFGTAHVLEVGKPTQTFRFPVPSESRCSFAEAERDIQARCASIRKNPNAEVRCVQGSRRARYSVYPQFQGCQ